MKSYVVRRHRIKSVRVYDNSKTGNIGFWLNTKSGRAYFSLSNERAIGFTMQRIRRMLPHLADMILVRTVWDEDELRSLLVGRYIYGKTEKKAYEGMFYNTIV